MENNANEGISHSSIILNYFNSEAELISHQKIIDYLWLKNILPGSSPYRNIKNYFSNKSKVFFIYERIQEAFYKEMCSYYRYLDNLKINGKKIIIYQNLLTALFCWINLQKSGNLKSLTQGLLKDYFFQKGNSSNFKFNTVKLAGEAVYYYKKMKFIACGSQESWYLTIQKHCIKKTKFNFLNNLHFDEPEVEYFKNLNNYTPLSPMNIINLKKADLDMERQKINYIGDFSGVNLAYFFSQNIKAIFEKYLLEDIRFRIFLKPSNNDSKERFLMKLKKELSHQRIKCPNLNLSF